MYRGYQITEEQLLTIQKRMATEKNKNVFRKLQVLELRAKGYLIKEVAEITGYHPNRISQLVSSFLKDGLENYAKDNRNGGNRKNLTYQEEAQILAPHFERAGKGQVITTQEIHHDFEEKVGHKMPTSTTYRILKRHGWRKIMPRAKHPKAADAETIEASKKLTQNSKKL